MQTAMVEISGNVTYAPCLRRVEVRISTSDHRFMLTLIPTVCMLSQSAVGLLKPKTFESEISITRKVAIFWVIALGFFGTFFLLHLLVQHLVFPESLDKH